MAKAKEVTVTSNTYGIQVSLTPEQSKTLLEDQEGVSSTDILSGIATSLLQDLAGGGMMIDPAIMHRIQDSTGTINDPAELIPMIDKGVKKSSGRSVYTWMPDPSYDANLTEIANMQGRDVQGMVQDGMDYIIEQGWLWQINFPPKTFKVNPMDLDFLVDLIGIPEQELSGADVVEYLRGLLSMKEKA